MSAASIFTAQLLSTSAPGLARLAAERLMPLLTDPAPYGGDAAALWREHLHGRLCDLSAALSDGRPRSFAEQVGWAKAAFVARGLPEADLRHSLRCLGEVLASELPANGQRPALELVTAALAEWETLGGPAPSELSAERPGGRLARRYVVALLEGDRRKACDLVLHAVRDGELDARDAILDLCLPVEKELGRMWHLGEITVAEEHFVSAATERLMGLLAESAPRAEPNGKTVVAAALTGDDHDIGLRAVTDLLELDGWRAVFLGSDLPPEELVWAAAAYGADLVVLSATLEPHLREIARAIAMLEERAAGGTRPAILVGGAPFQGRDEVWRTMGADATATARHVVDAARRLVGLPT